MIIKAAVLALCVLQCFASDAPMAGGVIQVDVNGAPPEFLRAVKMATTGVEPIEIKEITKQIVSGTMYNVKFSAGPSECMTSSGYKTSKCCHSQMLDCEVKYQVQPWKKSNLTLAFDQKENICKTSEAPEDDFDPELTESEYGPNDYNARDLFDRFIEKFNRTYRSDSNDGMYWKRFTVFKKNLKTIKKLQIHEKGSAIYGITEFTDYTSREYKKYLAPGFTCQKYETRSADIGVINAIPTSFDWRDHGAVTEVKNQGQCGSCWAFSTTGNVEGQWFLKKGKLLSLSEQELVDCDKTDQGCNGGLPSDAYKSIEKLGGLETEKAYPYDARDENCNFKSKQVAAYINDSVTLPKDEDKLASWLYKNGPISIGINAFAMQFYFGGVSHPWKFLCSPDSLDHGVLIVGYGVTDSNEPYWVIKNSWGPSWGEKGYYRIYRGDGSCGVNQMATSSIIE